MHAPWTAPRRTNLCVHGSVCVRGPAAVPFVSTQVVAANYHATSVLFSTRHSLCSECPPSHPQACTILPLHQKHTMKRSMSYTEAWDFLEREVTECQVREQEIAKLSQGVHRLSLRCHPLSAGPLHSHQGAEEGCRVLLARMAGEEEEEEDGVSGPGLCDVDVRQAVQCSAVQ